MKKLGVLGGGQLGLMLYQQALSYPLQVSFLDPDPKAPCKILTPHCQTGDYTDKDTVLEFAQDQDCLAIELEQVNLEALIQLKNEGKQLLLNPQTLKICQNKILQKEHLKKHHIPSSPFVTCVAAELNNVLMGEKKVVKLATGGFDGRGVWITQHPEDTPLEPTEELLVEDLVAIEKELAVMVVTDANGQYLCYDPVEMGFHGDNLLDYLLAPAQLPSHLIAKAIEMAITLAKSLNSVGLLAVEFFLDKSGGLLVNEFASRPHNSAHHSIEACPSSQFDQICRLALSLPLGSTKLISPAGMMNILGTAQPGSAKWSGLQEALDYPQVFFHHYGKAISKPLRKMGHLTALGHSVAEVKEKMATLRNLIQVNG